VILFIDDSTPGGGSGGAHRYWRINGIAVSGGNFELSELRLFDGSVDLTQIEYTSSSAPTLALSNLFDGSLGTRCQWSQSVANDAAFWIKADFKVPRPIDVIKMGGFDTANRYPSQFDLQWSDDNSSWTTQASITGLTYPGNNTLSGAIDVDGGGAVTAHRYWRLRNFNVTGVVLEISELQFFVGSDQVFTTISSSNAPSIGALANLVDGSLANLTRWADTTAEGAGFFIKLDFVQGLAEVDRLKLGAYTDSTLYPTQLTLQWSDDDSSWTTFGSASGLTYPGNNTLSGEITF
jgi:hypothetical protein